MTEKLVFTIIHVCVYWVHLNVVGICLCVYAQGRQRQIPHVIFYCSLPCYFETGFPTEPKSNHFMYGG